MITRHPRTTSERSVSSSGLEEVHLPVPVKLAGAWTSLMFFYLYVDYFALYKPGFLAGLMNGVVFEFDIDQMLMTVFLALMAIPMLMILASVSLPARANRVVNLIVASLNIPFAMFNAVGESWTWFYGLSIGLEVLILIYILRSSWTWPRRIAAPTT